MFVTKVKVSASWESIISNKEQLYGKNVFHAFEQKKKNWKIVSLKRDNAVQNFKYSNIIF